MNTESILFAFGLTLFAGLATGIGSIIAFFAKKFSPRFLSGSLGFSAGVMIYVSFVEIFVKSKSSFIMLYDERSGYWFAVISFFFGIALIAIIDKLVPSFENPHEIRDISDMGKNSDEEFKKNKLFRMGVLSALAIAIHNFPEGLATFIGGLQDPVVGVSIAIAVAIHNIPEGIAVSVPIYYATGSRKKAFVLSFFSGFAEPIGAIIGYFLILHLLTEALFGIVFGCVAGIMVYISLDELLPAAERYGEHHLATYGLIAGMIVMAISLLLLA